MSSRGQDPSRQPARPSASSSNSEDHSSAGSYGGGATRGLAGTPGQSLFESIATFPVTNRYRQLSEPISGGMGVVFKALHVELDIEVAVKRILPKFAAQTELIKRFEREARVQVRLKHPHLVPVRDYAKDKSGPYIVMDWIDGQDLAAVVKKSGPMEWQRAALLISKVASALQVAHHANIIHRDIKPGNILLDQNGEPYVTDFGLARIEARVEGASETAADAILGTINFAAPEQQRNPQDAVFQSDIWSLGATLYQLLTGHDVLGMRESLIPGPLREIVLKATERSIADRYQDMSEFSESLQRAAGKSATAVTASQSVKTEESTSTLADQWRRMRDQVQQTQAEARTIAEKRQDYATAVTMLESVPEHLRDADLFNEVRRRRDRVLELNEQIQTAVSQLRSDGLRPAIQELLKLQPKRSDMQQLLEELPEELTKSSLEGKAQSPQRGVGTGDRPPLLVAPFDSQQAKAAQEAWAKHLGIDVEVTNSLGMKFRVIPPGTFDMGSPESEPKRSNNETLHKVTITEPKLVGVYPVTQGEWTQLMGSNPSHFTGKAGVISKLLGRQDTDTSRFPVEHVSWDDAQEFIEKLNKEQTLGGWRYRLPTEAEWEYACRAGTVTPFWFGSELNGKQANCDGNYPYPDGSAKGPYLERPSVVGDYKANPFGIYDQHGQVCECCEDWYGEYDTSASQDPTGASSGSSRVLRGGSWRSNADYCRSARRYGVEPSYRGDYFGFRVVCELS